MFTVAPLRPDVRLQRIEHARTAVMKGHENTRAIGESLGVQPWIERSWERCMLLGHRPEQRVAFDPISTAMARRTFEANQRLAHAARPVLDQLGHAMAHTRYFAILTNAAGVVVDAHGPIDRSDRRAEAVTRVGVDLSEANIGTSAIGAALHELQPVWLHRGEHFFQDTSVYSCAGAPVFGPQGQCVGMLDLTGVEAVERPELVHLVAQSARSIENALVLHLQHTLLVRINWPGLRLGEEADGLVCLDADGSVLGMNPAALHMTGAATRQTPSGLGWHAGDLFALPFELLFDAARAGHACTEVPLWSGLRLNAQALLRNQRARLVDTTAAAGPSALPLKDLETSLILQAVRDARGNVAQAAKTLGISRATVYRKLSPAARRPH